MLFFIYVNDNNIMEKMILSEKAILQVISDCVDDYLLNNQCNVF